MATLYANNLYCSNTNAAVFRAWASFVHNVFMLGFFNVVDAAQIDLSAVAAPTATVQAMGFKIYRTNDALTPVYIKVEFGSGAAVLAPALWITIATSYTTGGTMGGVILTNRVLLTNTINNMTNYQVCFGSGAANRVCFALFLTTAGMPIWFSLERRKDATIADADTGLIVDAGLATTGHWSQCQPFVGLIPTAELGLQFILSTNNPAAYGNVIPEGLRIPCLGPSEPPGTNVALCNANDYGEFAEPTLTINAVDYKFKHAGHKIYNLRASTVGCNDTNTRLLLRYD
ncbi:MAG: hypothetical protein ACXW1W_02725 [Methylococcaceae bacterium]